MSFFELKTPKDILEKAHRERKRLSENFEIDNVFNFFVTAYHISDYIQKNKSVTQSALDKFLQDKDIKNCHDLCDKAKHFILTKRTNPETNILSGCVGGAPLGVLPVNGGDKWILLSEGQEVDIESLADCVLIKWDSFFSEHNL